ncbi:tetratricopeptide repeat protein [Pectinatus frisingensis]|uniref:tetratricopeptide repeat protein n=1 Tax=Pectinatus frisingensis TaxID=865 RepID=UPI0018C54117|nr:hypothetical protein [Pectinatus frisingensis]
MNNKYRRFICDGVPYKIVYNYGKGERAYREKKYDIAESFFIKLLNGAEQFSEYAKKEILTNIYFYLGEISQIKDDRAMAVQYYAKFLQEKPYDEEILLKFCHLLKPLDDKGEIVILNDIYMLDKDRLKFLTNILYRYFSDKTNLFYQKILREKYNTSVNNNMGENLLNAQIYDKSCDAFDMDLSDDYEFIIAISKNLSDKNVKSIYHILPDKYHQIMNAAILNSEKSDDEEINYNIKKINSIIRNYNTWKT